MTKRYAIKVSNLFERKLDDLSDYLKRLIIDISTISIT